MKTKNKYAASGSAKKAMNTIITASATKTLSAVLATTFMALGQMALGQGMEVFMDYGIFNSTAQNQPFLEIYTRVNTQTLQLQEYKKDGLAWYGGEVAIYTEVSDTMGNVEYSDASRVPGALFSERDSVIPQILDAQRIALNPGWKDIKIRVIDFHENSKEISGAGRIHINLPENQTAISSLTLLEQYGPTDERGPLVKSGYRLIPFVPASEHYYPQELETLNYYFEIYQTDRDAQLNGRYLLKTFIATEDNFIINAYSKFELADVSPTKPSLGRFNIADLPSGDYYLVAQVTNDQGEVLAEKKRFFRRQNPGADLDTDKPEAITASNTFAHTITSIDTLSDYINSLYPISSIPERGQADRVIAMGDLDIMQRFFYGFWVNRNAFEPEKAWAAYAQKVEYVNKKYGTRLRKGYNADRGRVYLQYGPPTDIDGRPYEPSAYPYEIWRYYTLQPNNQRNVIFVFVNKELSTNSYELLHSTAQGEINNYRWQMELYERTQADNNPDREDPLDHFGSSVNDNIILGPR